MGRFGNGEVKRGPDEYLDYGEARPLCKEKGEKRALQQRQRSSTGGFTEDGR